MTAWRHRLGQRSARKMSISLFNAVPAGAIEVLTDLEGSPQFKRADLGGFLGIVDVKATLRDVSTTSRKILSGGVCSPHPLQRQNDHDGFVIERLLWRSFFARRNPKLLILSGG